MTLEETDQLEQNEWKRLAEEDYETLRGLEAMLKNVTYTYTEEQIKTCASNTLIFFIAQRYE